MDISMKQYVEGSGEVFVQINRAIRVGQLCKIQPTEAFLGIECGTVRVMFIGSPADIYDYDDNMSKEIDAFSESMLDLCPEDNMELTTRFIDEPWVVYQYSRLHQDRTVLPLQEFVEHTTNY